MELWGKPESWAEDPSFQTSSPLQLERLSVVFVCLVRHSKQQVSWISGIFPITEVGEANKGFWVEMRLIVLVGQNPTHGCSICLLLVPEERWDSEMTLGPWGAGGC